MSHYPVFCWFLIRVSPPVPALRKIDFNEYPDRVGGNGKKISGMDIKLCIPALFYVHFSDTISDFPVKGVCPKPNNERFNKTTICPNT